MEREREELVAALHDLEHGLVDQGRRSRLGAGPCHLAGVQRIAERDPVGDEPQHGQGEEGGGHQPPVDRFGVPGPEPVETEEGPDLDAKEGGGQTEEDGLLGTPGQMAVDRPEDERDEQAELSANGNLAEQAGDQQQRHGGQNPGHGGVEALSQPEGEDKAEEGAGPGHHQPCPWGGAGKQGQWDGEQHR